MPLSLQLENRNNDPYKEFVKRNDTAWPIRRTPIDPDTGLPLDLTDAMAKFIMKDAAGVEKINAPAVIEDNADLLYNWKANPVWAAQTAAGGISDTLNAVAYGNGVFVVVGAAGTIQTSEDGETWVARTAAGGYSDDFQDVAFGNGIFIAVGATGAIQSSPDGETWIAQTPDAAYAGSFSGVTYAASMFVAVGASAEIQVSQDGVNWTARTSAVGFVNSFFGIGYGADLFVAVGENAEIQTSENAVTWTRRTAAAGASSWFQSVAYGADLFVIVGNDEQLQTSADGVTWVARALVGGFEGYLLGVTYGGNIFIASGAALAGTGAILVSSDGINWARSTPAGAPVTFGRSAYAQNKFVLIGSAASIETGDGLDTDTAGDYTAEFEITLADARKVTYPGYSPEPGKSFITVSIGADLGD